MGPRRGGPSEQPDHVQNDPVHHTGADPVGQHGPRLLLAGSVSLAPPSGLGSLTVPLVVSHPPPDGAADGSPAVAGPQNSPITYKMIPYTTLALIP